MALPSRGPGTNAFRASQKIPGIGTGPGNSRKLRKFQPRIRLNMLNVFIPSLFGTANGAASDGISPSGQEVANLQNAPEIEFLRTVQKKQNYLALSRRQNAAQEGPKWGRKLQKTGFWPYLGNNGPKVADIDLYQVYGIAKMAPVSRAHVWGAKRALRGILMPHGKIHSRCLAAIFDSQLPSPKLSLIMPPNFLSPKRKGLFSSFKIAPR